jgi:hypothetical protein
VVDLGQCTHAVYVVELFAIIVLKVFIEYASVVNQESVNKKYFIRYFSVIYQFQINKKERDKYNI